MQYLNRNDVFDGRYGQNVRGSRMGSTSGRRRLGLDECDVLNADQWNLSVPSNFCKCFWTVGRIVRSNSGIRSLMPTTAPAAPTLTRGWHRIGATVGGSEYLACPPPTPRSCWASCPHCVPIAAADVMNANLELHRSAVHDSSLHGFAPVPAAVSHSEAFVLPILGPVYVRRHSMPIGLEIACGKTFRLPTIVELPLASIGSVHLAMNYDRARLSVFVARRADRRGRSG